MTHLVKDASHMGHNTEIQHMVMLMVVLVMRLVMFRMPMVTGFSGLMMLLVHMYMKLLYLWNAPLYSEKLTAVHTLDKKTWYTIYLEK